MRVQAERVDQLTAIIDLIHDEWFQVDDVHHDPHARSVQVPFQRRGNDDHEREDWVLEINEVQRLVVEESEGIGRYDFNKLEYLPSSGRLTIQTGIPLAFYVDVAKLQVSVYRVTDWNGTGQGAKSTYDPS